jgi:hypothetical protein
MADTSPQHIAFEIRFGPYKPKIDESVAVPIYEEFFGNSTRYAIGLELDWQAYRIPYVGTIGAGVGWGYTRVAAPNVPVGSIPDGSVPDNSLIFQESTLNIMPMYAVGVLRLDVLAKQFHVPLVPYGKLGLASALWWVNDGIDTARDAEGRKGSDISTGTQAAFGAMFLLDILEPSAARELDLQSGVNNSYLFFEWSMSNYPGDQMNVGSNSWVTGLAFEM